MTVEKLQRVLWRLRQTKPGEKRFTREELAKAIMMECGTDGRTLRDNRAALKRLGWIKPHSGNRVELTDKDITE